MGQLALACGTDLPIDHDIRVGDPANPLSFDGQPGRRLCAGGRPTAGYRLLLCPISQGACRKSRAVVVLMAGPSVPLRKFAPKFRTYDPACGLCPLYTQ